MERKTTTIEKKVFKYLNELRESGETNMYGARPYIMRKFRSLDSLEAKLLLTRWRRVFNKEGNYGTINDPLETEKAE